MELGVMRKLGFSGTEIKCSVNLNTNKHDQIAVTHSGTTIVLTLDDGENPDAIWFPEQPISIRALPTGVKLSLERKINSSNPKQLEMICNYQTGKRNIIEFEMWVLAEPDAKEPVRVDPQLILEPDGGSDPGGDSGEPDLQE